MHKPEVGDIMSTIIKDENILSAHYGEHGRKLVKNRVWNNCTLL